MERGGAAALLARRKLYEDAFPLISLFAQSSRKILCEISFRSLVNRETRSFFLFSYPRERVE